MREGWELAVGELVEVGSMGDDDGWIFIRGLRGNAELQSVLREDSIAGSSSSTVLAQDKLKVAVVAVSVPR